MRWEGEDKCRAENDWREKIVDYFKVLTRYSAGQNDVTQPRLENWSLPRTNIKLYHYTNLFDKWLYLVVYMLVI
jgi:hypothetical protein